jgi:DNA-binding NtrC family response regulator
MSKGAVELLKIPEGTEGDDERLAGQSAARLLITAPSRATADVVARSINDSSLRARFPLVRMPAADFPVSPGKLSDVCSSLLGAAAGGTVLLSDVDEMPSAVQGLLLEVLDDLEYERAPAGAIRLVSGTSVSLLDRVAAGTFSERLFYRLNSIHLMI